MVSFLFLIGTLHWCTYAINVRSELAGMVSGVFGIGAGTDTVNDGVSWSSFDVDGCCALFTTVFTGVRNEFEDFFDMFPFRL